VVTIPACHAGHPTSRRTLSTTSRTNPLIFRCSPRRKRHRILGVSTGPGKPDNPHGHGPAGARARPDPLTSRPNPAWVQLPHGSNVGSLNVAHDPPGSGWACARPEHGTRPGPAWHGARSDTGGPTRLLNNSFELLGGYLQKKPSGSLNGYYSHWGYL